MTNTLNQADVRGAPDVGRGQFLKGLSIKVSIAGVVVASMLLVAAVVLALGWAGAKQTLLATAANTASDAGTLISERSRRLLEPAQSTLRQMSFDPIVDAYALPQRLQRLHVLTEVLAVNPLVSAVYVGYKDGQFLLVRPLDSEAVRDRVKAPLRAAYLVQSRALMPDGNIVGEYLFYDGQDLLVESRRLDDYTYDPRTRPWYQKAENSSMPVLAEPYVFFTTRQAGLTLSQSSRSGAAVIGIDMVLDDISSSLNTMRITPHAQMALVNDRLQVLAYPDMSRVMVEADKSIQFKTLEALGEPSLVALANAKTALLEPRFFEIAGQELLGITLPFNVWPGQRMRLMVTVPVEELLGDLAHKRQQIVLLVMGMVALLLPLGWLAGARIGKSLERLRSRATQIAQFDFSSAPLPNTAIREVNHLSSVMGEMSDTIQSFLRLSQQMASEPDVERMLDGVLTQLVAATRCQGGAAYLWNHESERMELAATEGQSVDIYPAHFSYAAQRRDRSAARPVPAGMAQLDVELRGRTGVLQGMLVLLHADDDGHRDTAFMHFAHQLSGMLALSIETRQLIDSQKKLLDAVIRLMADAIDAKSPYTGGHCERVPELATMLVDHMSNDTAGPYADFSMTEDQRYEFYLGAWLHDCGKVTSPEHIVDKATKLEVIYNRIHEVRTRFEVLWRDAEIAHLQRVLAGEPEADSLGRLQAQQAQLQDDYAFVAKCNVGGEFMADEAIERLKSIAGQTWLRYFDDRQGLAIEEARRLAEAVPVAPELPVRESLLADRPEHVVPWGSRKPPIEKGDPNNLHGFDMTLPAHQQNMGELYNLAIRRGTLTDEDRFKINDHIVQTLIMLKGLPWPQQLARVPEIAATHHEKMDGKGYPRRLPASQLTVADRVMALADIFEALTAADRPYKPPKTLTESLRIMAFMCKDQHLDTELFRYFLHSGLWRTFAQRYMQPGQVDAVDVAAIEKLLPAPPAPAAVAAPAAVGVS